MATADLRASESVGTLVDIVDAEFREMPGMRLTCAQARRLWNMSPAVCREVFGRLLKAGALDKDETGRYGLPRHV